ncbi:hypothetical protein [Enterococcus dongliensis]|uniref:hypothetical protein n=1 Tax=Enterococcus dongliensis TaxID=2559925 RepID=UPI0028919D7B|nr:hypothetical protein [Enterococcus dongliensis]MDT2669506.1 hypothetical protein [Enterococcus dongliensis]
MSKLKEYLKSELLLMPSYLKNGLLNEIKETNTVNDNEDIDTFLSRILENDMESFLVGYNHLEMRKSFKYSALFKLEDSRKISEVLDSIISDGDNSEGIANRQKEYSVSRIDDSIKVWIDVNKVDTKRADTYR